jgi:hypothetical protein
MRTHKTLLARGAGHHVHAKEPVMDREAFDTLSRLFAATPSRRTALAALLGLAVSGTLGPAAAKPNRRKQRNRAEHRTAPARVQAEAVQCEPPRPSAKLTGCDYSGRDLRGAVMRSSTLTDAKFVGANLCGANLSSSQLRRADFTNANLTQANLRSSGCAGAVFTGATFCRTIGCDGKVINPDCTGCCTDAACGPGSLCVDGVCKDICDEPRESSTDCLCAVAIDGERTVCIFPARTALGECTAANPTCPDGTVCIRACTREGSCFRPCLFPADCACAADTNICSNPVKCGSVSPPAA